MNTTGQWTIFDMKVMPVLEEKTGLNIMSAEKHKAEGNAHFQAGNFRLGVASYSLAMDELRAKDSSLIQSLLTNRSLCFFQLEDWKASLDDANVCCRLFPHHCKAQYRRALALEKLQRFTEAYEAALVTQRLWDAHQHGPRSDVDALVARTAQGRAAEPPRVMMPTEPCEPGTPRVTIIRPTIAEAAENAAITEAAAKALRNPTARALFLDQNAFQTVQDLLQPAITAQDPVAAVGPALQLMRAGDPKLVNVAQSICQSEGLFSDHLQLDIFSSAAVQLIKQTDGLRDVFACLLSDELDRVECGARILIMFRLTTPINRFARLLLRAGAPDACLASLVRLMVSVHDSHKTIGASCLASCLMLA